jgi:hypothetical protein
VRVRRCNRLDSRDVTVKNGIPVTTVARTIVDLAELLTAAQLANVMYEAAYRGLLDLDAVRATAARLTGRHHAHVLDMHLAGSATKGCGPAGYTVLRFRDTDVVERPDEVVQALIGIMAPA